MIAVRPPEYFPRLSYMALVQHVDHFVLADTFQYSRQTFQNRSKLRNPEGWQWISVPLFGRQHGRSLRDVEIDSNVRWLERHWRAFMYNYRSTMYFEYYESSFQPFFDREWARLGPLACRSVELLCELLEIDTPLRRASELEGAPDSVPAIMNALGADTLLAPAEVASHEDVEVSAVRAFHYDHPTYRQNFEGFEPGMSAADVVFNYGPEAPRIITRGARVAAPQTPSSP